jgi:hypothetical protein
MVMSILNYLMSNGVRVWTIKDNFRLGEDIQSKVLAFAFGLSAEIERELISQRTKETLARRRLTPHCSAARLAAPQRRVAGTLNDVALMVLTGDISIERRHGFDRRIDNGRTQVYTPAVHEYMEG